MNYHHFYNYVTSLFKTLLSTLQYPSVNHTIHGKCVIFTAIETELDGIIKMEPNYPVNLRRGVIYLQLRAF